MQFSFYWPIFKKTMRLGARSLFMHSLRSLLTILGIVFGVCAVIAMLAIGEGASKKAQQDIARLGSTNLIIETVRPPQEQGQSGNQSVSLNYGLTYNDAESLRNTIPNIEVVVPIREISQEARFENRKTAIKVIGTIPWHS
jgi:putative ABC transport system permease protein